MAQICALVPNSNNMTTESTSSTAPRQRVLVLGATGTIGQAEVKSLLRQGHEVVCFIRAKAGVNGKLSRHDWQARLPCLAYRAKCVGAVDMAKIGRRAYAEMFGPTTGDRVRLADTNLWIEVEHDYTTYGEEVKFGGGKVIRDGMGQSQRHAAEVVDITGALLKPISV